MPRLTKPFPEFNSTADALKKIISMHLKQKNYSNFELQEYSFEFTPYYVFEFEAFSEKEKIVSENFSGKTALNAFSKELEDIAEFFSGKMVQEIPGEISFKVLPEKLSGKDVEKLASIRLSKKLSVPKENIIVSEIEEFFLPKWIAKISLNGKNHSLKINLFTSKISSSPEIPLKEKNWKEITSETIEELKEPKAWIEYSSSIVKDTAAHPATKSFFTSLKENLLHNELLQIIILIIVLFILIFLTF